MMKSFAFKSKIEDNAIVVPEHLAKDLKDMNTGEVRVILLVEDIAEFDDAAFKEFAAQFFRKYASNLEQIKKMIDNSNA
jgi:hypothetical protein